MAAPFAEPFGGGGGGEAGMNQGGMGMGMGGGHLGQQGGAFGGDGGGGGAHAHQGARSSMYYADSMSAQDNAIGGGGGGGGGSMSNSAFSGLAASNPMAAAGLNMGRQFLDTKVRSYIPGLTAFWDSLHYYFDVNNDFVLNRLKCLVVPFAHTNWDREVASEGGLNAHAKYKPPSGDMNAPDLYIPLMSFITFVLVTGLLKGTNMTFTPEVLGDVVGSSIITQVLEICILKTAMWFAKCPSVPILDLVAYTGYKYFGLTINTAIGIFGGALIYYVVLLFTGGAMSFYMFHTIQAVVRARGGVGRGAQLPATYLAVSVAGLQMVVMWWLGHSGDL